MGILDVYNLYKLWLLCIILSLNNVASSIKIDNTIDLEQFSKHSVIRTSDNVVQYIVPPQNPTLWFYSKGSKWRTLLLSYKLPT